VIVDAASPAKANMQWIKSDSLNMREDDRAAADPDRTSRDPTDLADHP
jgi:hypothetical protein